MDRAKTSRAEIPPPEGIVFREIDPTNGRLWRPGCAGPVREAFLEGTEPETDCRGTGRTLLARVRGNPEPPEISDATWRRWSAEPIVRRRAEAPRAKDDGDERPRLARRGGIAQTGQQHERDRERAAKRAEEWRKDEEKRFERLRKEREKRGGDDDKKRDKDEKKDRD
jgi:hypothetical protein